MPITETQYLKSIEGAGTACQLQVFVRCEGCARGLRHGGTKRSSLGDHLMYRTGLRSLALSKVGKDGYLVTNALSLLKTGSHRVMECRNVNDQ
jgi:hypothetical protein